MPPNDSSPNPNMTGGLEPGSEAPVPGGDSTKHTGKVRTSRLWSLALGAGLLAALIGWAVGEATYGLIRWDDARDVLQKYSAELKKMGPYEQTDFITKRMTETHSLSESLNAAIEFGGLGAALGLLLGLGGGAVAGSSRSGVRGGVIGLALGAALGGAMGFLVIPLYFRYYSPTSGLEVPLAAHAGLLLPPAAACGLALGIGLGRRGAIIRCVAGAILGALVAVVVFEIANTILFPLAKEPAPIPGERVGRLIVELCSGLFVAAFAALGAAGISDKDRVPAH
jgi:hypothetical protein